MIKINEVIVVEGKYDKIKLSSIFDTMIIVTNGFGVFSDSANMQFIKTLAEERGIVVLTDSDHAGFMIRARINGCIDKQYIKHVYIPDVYGKERRKTTCSKEGKLGVEGIENSVIIGAFERAGITSVKADDVAICPITTLDLYNDGITGGQNSKRRKGALLLKLSFPEHLSTKALIKALNSLMSYDEYKKIISELDDCNE